MIIELTRRSWQSAPKRLLSHFVPLLSRVWMHGTHQVVAPIVLSTLLISKEIHKPHFKVRGAYSLLFRVDPVRCPFVFPIPLSSAGLYFAGITFAAESRISNVITQAATTMKPGQQRK